MSSSEKIVLVDSLVLVVSDLSRPLRAEKRARRCSFSNMTVSLRGGTTLNLDDASAVAPKLPKLR